MVIYGITAVLMAGCSGSSRPEGARPRDRNLITREEIVETQSTNAFEVVQRLRNRWFRSRVRSLRAGSSQPVVYVDDQFWGDVDTLRRIPVEAVEEIRYLNAREATMRGWNVTNAGVIQVISRAGADEAD